MYRNYEGRSLICTVAQSVTKTLELVRTFVSVLLLSMSLWARFSPLSLPLTTEIVTEGKSPVGTHNLTGVLALS